MWRRFEGSAGGGLAPVKARAAFEGCAHAIRGLPGGESTREVRELAVQWREQCQTRLAQGAPGYHSVITVSGMAEQ